MLRFALATVLAALPILALPAAAAPGCRITPMRGLLTPHGATVTMRVANTAKPCGELLWVQRGVIPFTVLQQKTAPQHGVVALDDPTHFTYLPEPDYQGRDQFDIIARGDSAGGSEVTGTLHVNVIVTR